MRFYQNNGTRGTASFSVPAREIPRVQSALDFLELEMEADASKVIRLLILKAATTRGWQPPLVAAIEQQEQGDAVVV
jgi:hypothetical protein